jgi:hypothetical protein
MVTSSTRLPFLCLVGHVFPSRLEGWDLVERLFSDLSTLRAPSSLQWLLAKVVKVST